jgi:hypothetical protein
MHERFDTGRRASPALALLVAGLVVTGLAACTAPEEPAPAASVSAAPSASVEAPVIAPTLSPTGSAADNLAFFDSVNSSFLAADPMPGGRAILDNLVAAGFDKAAMQVTADETTIGRDVDSVQFSVRFGDRCLIGQAAASGYAGIEAPAVAGDRCLIGETRPIDW